MVLKTPEKYRKSERDCQRKRERERERERERMATLLCKRYNREECHYVCLSFRKQLLQDGLKMGI